MKTRKILRIWQISSVIFTIALIIDTPEEWYMSWLLGGLGGFAVVLFVLAIYEIKRRRDNGIDMFATLETDKEKLKKHMLLNMQYNGPTENLKEFNDTRNGSCKIGRFSGLGISIQLTA